MNRLILGIIVAMIVLITIYQAVFREEHLRYNITGNLSDEMHVIFYDSSGERVATATLMNRGLHGECMSFRFSLWHEEGTKIKSLKLKLTPSATSEIYLKTPDGYPWNPIKLQHSEDAHSIIFEVPDLGFQGKGTITLDFMVLPLEESDNLSIHFDIEFGMSRGLKEYVGEGSGILKLS